LREKILSILLMITIGLLFVDIVLRVSCCLLGGQARASAAQSVWLVGSGSTFIYPQMEHWISLFTKYHPEVTITYMATGSGTGQAQLLDEKVVDFACSDPPLSREKYERFRGRILQMPVIIGAVAVVYKIPGYHGPLNLSADVIADIYRGVIRYWDDPRIKALNPAAKLPHVEIKAIHRADASGTTEVFTFFLHKAAPDHWPSSLVGKTVEWPVDKTGRGIGAKGNQGVASEFKALDSAITYVELGYALENNFSIAAIRNADGVFVLPNTSTIQAAVREALRRGLLPDSPASDWSGALNAIVYAPGGRSYSIVSFTFMIVWTSYPRVKAEAIREFIQFINTVGQEHVVEGYVPIPEELRSINLKAVGMVKGEG
jgi:phosphate transport system substrate-binding protein